LSVTFVAPAIAAHALHFVQLGFGDHTVLVGIKMLEHPIHPVLAIALRHFLKAEAAIIVGIMPLQHALDMICSAVAATLGLAGLGGRGKFLSGQLTIAIGVSIGKVLRSSGSDLIAGDLTIGVQIKALEHHLGATLATRAILTSAIMRSCDNGTRGNDQHYSGCNQGGTFHIRLHLLM